MISWTYIGYKSMGDNINESYTTQIAEAIDREILSQNGYHPNELDMD